MKRKILFAAVIVVTALVFYVFGIVTAARIMKRGKKNDSPYSLLKDVLPPDQLKNDYDYYTAKLTSLHPGLYKWHTKKEMTRLIDSVGQLLNKPRTRGEFFNYLSIINYRIGCSHTNVDLSMKDYSSDVFPLPIVWIDSAFYSNCDDCTIPKGSKIIAVNGMAMEKIADRLKIYGCADGCDETILRKQIIWHFPFKYLLAFGYSKEFKITFQEPGTNKIKSDTLKAKQPIMSFSPKWHSFWYDDFEYDFKLIDSTHTAVLKLTTFTYGNESKQTAYRNFLENSFRLLSLNPQYKNLIIDLRNNQGGDNGNCYLLYSYLTNKTFCEDSIRGINNFSLPEDNYLGGISATFFDSIKKADYSLLPDKIHLSFNLPKAKKWSVSKYAFKGKIFVITNATTSSAGVRLAALLQINDGVKVIGEKPNGSYCGSTSYFMAKYRLSNSSIDFTVPLVNVKYNLRSHPYADNAGLQPDYLVPLDLQDFLTDKDTQTEFIRKRLVKN